MFNTLTSTSRQVPDPQVPTYYWYRHSEKDAWLPVLVTPKSETWPAVANIAPHNPAVSELKGEWRLCPFPTE